MIGLVEKTRLFIWNDSDTGNNQSQLARHAGILVFYT